ncbi:unnamed protein product, partial [Trichogramma brassicae]
RAWTCTDEFLGLFFVEIVKRIGFPIGQEIPKNQDTEEEDEEGSRYTCAFSTQTRALIYHRESSDQTLRGIRRSDRSQWYSHRKQREREDLRARVKQREGETVSMVRLSKARGASNLYNVYRRSITYFLYTRQRVEATRRKLRYSSVCAIPLAAVRLLSMGAYGIECAARNGLKLPRRALLVSISCHRAGDDAFIQATHAARVKLKCNFVYGLRRTRKSLAINKYASISIRAKPYTTRSASTCTNARTPTERADDILDRIIFRDCNDIIPNAREQQRKKTIFWITRSRRANKKRRTQHKASTSKREIASGSTLQISMHIYTSVSFHNHRKLCSAQDIARACVCAQELSTFARLFVRAATIETKSARCATRKMLIQKLEPRNDDDDERLHDAIRLYALGPVYIVPQSRKSIAQRTRKAIKEIIQADASHTNERTENARA